ncbi:MAG: RidA family protein, partial [Gammaproteobacteria bacterium]|nr:RidA family protein [Gammaproteobacteria bacterium]
MSITRHHSNQRMSQIVIHGDTVYLAGQVADDASADITVQTRQVLQKIEKLLGEAGS